MLLQTHHRLHVSCIQPNNFAQLKFITGITSHVLLLPKEDYEERVPPKEGVTDCRVQEGVG